MALAGTETFFDYNVKHAGGYAEGICGVTDHWNPLLEEKGIKKNSVAACIEIYNFLLEQNNYNQRAAIKEYKGIESKHNYWIIDKVQEYIRIIRKVN